MLVELAGQVKFNFATPQLEADGFRLLIAGESGSGKSHVAASVIGQVLEQGGEVHALDSHGEYGPLAALSDRVLLVGYEGKGRRHLPLEVDRIEEYLDRIAHGYSLFFNLKEWADIEPEKLSDFAFPLLKEIYRLRRRKPKLTFLLVEEAHNYAPQSKIKGVAEQARILIGIATGGRKFGLNAVYCTQRLAILDKTVIAGCNVKCVMRMSDVADWESIRRYIPERLGITYDKKGTGLRYFGNGEAIILSRHLKDDLRSHLSLPGVAPQKDLPSMFMQD